MRVRFAPDTRQWTAGDTTRSASRTQQTDAEERAMAAETGVCSLQTPAEDLAASFKGRDSKTTVLRRYLRLLIGAQRAYDAQDRQRVLAPVCTAGLQPT